MLNDILNDKLKIITLASKTLQEIQNMIRPIIDIIENILLKII